MKQIALSIVLVLAAVPSAFAQSPTASAESQRGFWDDSGTGSDTGLGLLLAGKVSLVKREHHHLSPGVEYAPVFTSSMTIHNVGVVIGYQFIR